MKKDIEFILLHTTKFGEKSLVLHTLSKEYGKRSLFLRSVPKNNSIFSPMSVLEGELIEQTKIASSMPNVSKLSLRYPLISMRNNVYKSCISIFMAEILYRALKESAIEEGLYETCIAKILLLEELEKDFANFPILFMIDTLAAMGYSPRYQDLEFFLLPEQKEIVKNMLSLDFSEAMLVPLNGPGRNAILISLLKYLEINIDQSLNIRSLSILRELLSC